MLPNHHIQLLNAVGFYRQPKVLEAIPVSDSSLWDCVSKGLYPKPHKIGPKMTAWAKRDIHLLCLMVEELEDYFQYIKDNGGSFEQASTCFLATIAFTNESPSNDTDSS